MIQMPSWVLRRLSANLPGLLLASAIPALFFWAVLFFALLLETQPEGLVGEAAKQQRKDVLGYFIYAVLFLMAGAHGLIWSVSKLFLDQPFNRWGERFSFAIGWAPLRSLFWTFVWLLFAIFAYIAAGMVLGMLGFKDPGMLLDSTGDQAAALADGTREVVERGDISQPITLEDFDIGRLRIAAAFAGVFGIWIYLKALVAVPMRVMGLVTNLVTAQNSLPLFAGIRATIWVILGGALVGSVNAFVLSALPQLAHQAAQGILFVISIWMLGGMLAWHAQKSAD